MPNLPIITETYGALGVNLTQGAPDVTSPRFSLLASRDGMSVLPVIPNFGALVNAIGIWTSVYNSRFRAVVETPNSIFPDFLAMNSTQPDLLSELMGPFSAFLDDYGGLEGTFKPLIPLWTGLTNVGFGSLLDLPTFMVLKNIAPYWLSVVFGNGFHATNGCSSAYNAMADRVGWDNILLDASFRVNRKDDKYTRIQYTGKRRTSSTSSPYSADGKATCGKLLIAAYPTVANLESFMQPNDLDDRELGIFGKVCRVQTEWGHVHHLSQHCCRMAAAWRGCHFVYQHCLAAD